MNIPEDVVKVQEPVEGEMAVMSMGVIKRYSSTEEANGRINPALQLGSEDEDETIPSPKKLINKPEPPPNYKESQNL